MRMKNIVPRPLPYKDVVTRDMVRDYLYRRTGVLVKEPWIEEQIRSKALRTITRPPRYGGGTFTRKAWLEDFIRMNS